MKKWNELKSKGHKYDRIRRATISLEVRRLIQESLNLYCKTKNKAGLMRLEYV